MYTFHIRLVELGHQCCLNCNFSMTVFASLFDRVSSLFLLLLGQHQCGFSAQTLSCEDPGQYLATAHQREDLRTQTKGHTFILCHLLSALRSSARSAVLALARWERPQFLEEPPHPPVYALLHTWLYLTLTQSHEIALPVIHRRVDRLRGIKLFALVQKSHK